MLREIKNKTIVYSIVAVLLATSLGVVCLNFGFHPSLFPISVSALDTFTSYEELNSFLQTNQDVSSYQYMILDTPRTP